MRDDLSGTGEQCARLRGATCSAPGSDLSGSGEGFGCSFDVLI
ncbi:hypothetical protein [Bacteroides nordii]|nr:hypothetical protein [Bacteroides nordii]